MSVVPVVRDHTYYIYDPSRVSFNIPNLEEYLRWWLPKKILNSSLGNSFLSTSLDGDQFQINVEVDSFKPEEISVKIIGSNTILIEGKHEEKQDKQGYISRHFVRKCQLPEGCDTKLIKATLSSDGILTISVPKETNNKKTACKEISVSQSGKPSKLPNLKHKL